MANRQAGEVMYANMEFPEYEFREYPKWVALESGDPVLCQDETEEATVLAGSEVVREADERAALIEALTAKGVTFDKRWGVDKLQAALDGAG